ncbi:hypothetical protein ABT104_06240 [Streptomyces mobaraensis]|uniref:hypothetical protein n=1 Tax=Streptomyces mobaraensis TaxID=35621 RepID=UPI003318BE39
MAEFDFPEDLRAAQVALHRAHAELTALLEQLPWSVEPMKGWTADPEPARGYRSERPDSPGWTSEQKEAVAALRKRALELSVFVGTHAFWKTVETGKVVEARMQLKRIQQEPAAEDAAAA